MSPSPGLCVSNYDIRAGFGGTLRNTICPTVVSLS